MQFYTTGYSGKDVNDLKPMLESRDAMLIDIRFAPYSRVMHWRKVYLKTLLGDRYRHLPNLGNRTYKEDKITIQNLELGLETLLSIGRDAVLMCACEIIEKCHRSVIVRELLRREIESRELENWERQ